MKRLIICSRFVFSFVVYLFISNIVLLRAEISSDLPAISEAIEQPQNSFKGFDFEKMQKLAFDFMVKKGDERTHNLELVSDADRALMLQAYESYENFIENVDLVKGLTRSCAYISAKLQESCQCDAALQGILDSLNKLHKGLINGSFLKILNHAQQNLGNASERESSLTMADIVFVINALSKTAAVADQLKDKQFAQAWELLKSILSALHKQDIHGLTAVYLKHLQPHVHTTQTILTDVIIELEQRQSLLPFDGDGGRRRAFVSLMREIQEFVPTLSIFAHLQNNATGIESKTHTLFTAITYLFDGYRALLAIYLKDHESGLFRTIMLHCGLRSALATWCLFIIRSDMSGAMLADKMIGKSSVESLSIIDLAKLYISSLKSASGFFLFPGNTQVPGYLKEAGKVAAVLGYYHLFHCLLFDEVGTIETFDEDCYPINKESRPRGNEKFFYDKTFLKENSGGIDSIWPRDYQYLRCAVFNALKTGEKSLFKKVHEYLHMHLGSQIEQIGDATQGVIRPELIGDLAETFLPLIMLSWQDLIHCTQADVYDKEFKIGVRDQLETRYHIGKDFFLDDVLANYEQKENVNIKAYYVEYRILSYVFSSLGEYWGKKFTQKYQDRFPAWGESFLNLFVKKGWMSDDMAKKLGKECSDGIDGSMVELNKQIKDAFVLGSAARLRAVGTLEFLGLMKKREKADDAVTSKEILDIILKNFGLCKLMSYFDIGKIKQEYKQDPTKINEIADKITNIVRSNLFVAGGGFIGSLIVSKLGSLVMWKCGPFYPTIQKQLGYAN